MNKILVDGDKYLLDSNKLNIDVFGNAKIYINNYQDDIYLHINMVENSILEIYDFNLTNKFTKIDITQSSNTSLKYFSAFKIDEDYNFEYNVNILGDNNINELNISGISNGNALIKAIETVNKKTVGNVVGENIKILTIDGVANILPILHIDALDVIANHNTAISNIRDEELMYLLMKGLNKNVASDLIINGYLYGIFKDNEDFLNIIK